MKALYESLNEFEKMSMDFETFSNRMIQKSIVALSGIKSKVLLGQGLGLKVNCSVGLNSLEDIQTELEKVNSIAKHKSKPDIMMDLSTTKLEKPLYRFIQEIVGCPVGTIPYYTCFDAKGGIDPEHLVETIEEQAKSGVSFMTLHLTANLKLAERALTRRIPIISRGGSLLLRDIKINNRKENVLLGHLDEILPILKQYNIAVSVGTTYRPSTQNDALDSVHLDELKVQRDICVQLRENGICVLMEGIGHIPFFKIPEYVSLMREDTYIPFMPLGPIVSDHTNGLDHITNAVGASYMSLLGGADIINTVTREEHTGGVPNIQSILEALDVTAAVVQIVNDNRFVKYMSQSNMTEYQNCMGVPEKLGCTRCNNECPFIWNEEVRTGKS